MLYKGKRKQARRGQMAGPRSWKKFCLKNIRFCKIKVLLTGLSLDVSIHFGGRGCFWGAVLILSSVFRAPLSFVPFSTFFFFFAEANGGQRSFVFRGWWGISKKGERLMFWNFYAPCFHFAITNGGTWLMKLIGYFFQSHCKDPDT